MNRVAVARELVGVAKLLVSGNALVTGTHYVDGHGQHYLPKCLQHKRLKKGFVVLDWDELDELGEREVNEVEEALSGLGCEYDKDSDGLTITSIPEETVKVAKSLVSGKDDACGEKGCIRKSGDGWKVMSGKTGEFWPQTYKSRTDAENALKRYHGWGFKK